MSDQIPQWVRALETPDPEMIVSIYEQTFPQVIEQFEHSASRLSWWRIRKRRAMIDALETKHVHAKIDEKQREHWGTSELGVHFVGLNQDTVPAFLEYVPHNTSLEIINTLAQEQRDALANSLTNHFCAYVLDVPNHYSLRDLVGQKASRLERTFHTLLPKMYETIWTGVGEAKQKPAIAG